MDNTNALNWFEIAVTDLDRAIAFYQQIFDITMGEPMEMMGMKMAFFPSGKDMVGGRAGTGPYEYPLR